MSEQHPAAYRPESWEELAKRQLEFVGDSLAMVTA